MASQQQLAEQLFATALALNPEERDAFLEDVCGNDLELRRMVEDFLIQDACAGNFLQHPAHDLLYKAGMSASPDTAITHSVNGHEQPCAPLLDGRLRPGQILIDRFVVVRLIAQGGMGEVYEVEDRLLQGVHVALKTILPYIADDPALQQHFEREVLLAQQVNHENLCPIYAIFRCEEPPPGFLFLTMKLLPGKTLATRLRESVAPMPIEEGLAILKQIALGLAAIHRAGIIHRDIKPTNIVLDGFGSNVRLYITDFGLARAYEGETTISGRGAIAGTPEYIAPELFLGHPPSQASDLFALGVVLHQVFCGQKPIAVSDNSSVAVSPRLRSSDTPSFCIDLVEGCLDADPKRRCEAFEHVLALLDPNNANSRSIYRNQTVWTRRRFVGAAAAVACALAAGTWWQREQFENLLHPLPQKRFVALLHWPANSDAGLTPMVTGVLNAIKSELTRVEAFDRDLFVVSPEDLNRDVAGATQLKEICDPLGANLALAASGIPGDKHFQLFLRVVDPSSNRALRGKTLACGFGEITSLPVKAVHAAASLLDLSHYLRSSELTGPGTQSTAAFTAFQSAETLRKQPNDKGLEPAIEKYKEAIDLDPSYAIAHAQLAQAYCRLYDIQRDPGALELARGNCERALALNPVLVEGHLALGAVFEEIGDVQGALDEIRRALALDPSNPRAMLRQAEIYTRLNQWGNADKTFQRVLKERPNNWVIHNEWGFALHSEGKFQEAIKAFRASSLAAPRSALPLSNLGVEYLQTGDFAAATESLKKSLALDPNFDEAAANISLALRYQSKFGEALPFALKAVQLNPTDDTNWLELGECYSSLPNRQSDAKAAYLRAAKEVQRHLQTDAANGAGWMLLALYQVKAGSPQNALALVQRAESLGAGDMDSQLYKARILELVGRRDEALATLSTCFHRGANDLQMVPFFDMKSLRDDPRYRQMLKKEAV
jgi:tetratricopeptide (TPR) repeat protein